MRKFATLLIRGYRYLISPYLPPSCRFYPTCSEYTLQAIQTHGLLRGISLGSRRICRCHPFSKGGYDPVPAVRDCSEICTSDDRDVASAANHNHRG